MNREEFERKRTLPPRSLDVCLDEIAKRRQCQDNEDGICIGCSAREALKELRRMREERALLVAVCEWAEKVRDAAINLQRETGTVPVPLFHPVLVLQSRLASWRAHTEARGK